jgi:hypothetical protein
MQNVKDAANAASEKVKGRKQKCLQATFTPVRLQRWQVVHRTKRIRKQPKVITYPQAAELAMVWMP